jgi:hypothetical protein
VKVTQLQDRLWQPLELDDPHQRHQCSCIKTLVIELSCRPSTQNRAQYKSFNDKLGTSREIGVNGYLGKSMEHTVGRDELSWVTQCVTGLICQPSKLRSLCNISQY